MWRWSVRLLGAFLVCGGVLYTGASVQGGASSFSGILSGVAIGAPGLILVILCENIWAMQAAQAKIKQSSSSATDKQSAP